MRFNLLWPALAAAALPLQAQLTYPGCSALAPSDFQATELFNKNATNGAAGNSDLSEPTHMDVRVVNGAGGQYDHSDIIFVERLGKVKWYDGVLKKVSTIGTISVHATPGSSDDNGLMGVAFHPDFEKNRWVYFWYSPSQMLGQNRQLRLTRITLKPDNTLDMASEKILFNFKGSKTDQWHSGGPMVFDSYGDLWGTVGNNSPDLDPASCDAGGNVLSKTDSTQSAEWGPSNTHSLRGGFWRIHPDSSAKGYSVPAGNFSQYWADQFEKQGNAALAAQYRDTTKVLPEIYVKGERSNFSIAVHPTKRWLAWGTVSYASVNDKFTITDHPIFSGFPYFMRDNKPTCNHGKSVDAPVNNSPFNSGVTQLPPATAGSIVGLVNVAIGGPIYTFDPCLNSDAKFPPHFHNHWIVAGFQGGMWIATLDTAKLTVSGTPQKLDGSGNLFGSVSIRNHIQSLYGKDGALYILNYDGYYNSAINPGATRVVYKGSCKVSPPAGACATTPVAKAPPYQKIWFDPWSITVGEEVPHVLALYDMNGRLAWSVQGMGKGEYRFSDIKARGALRSGVYQARVITPAGEYSRKISLF